MLQRVGKGCLTATNFSKAALVFEARVFEIFKVDNRRSDFLDEFLGANINELEYAHNISITV